MRFENEIEELKSMNNQLKNQIEQMSLELKEAATDEQKFLSQVKNSHCYYILIFHLF